MSLDDIKSRKTQKKLLSVSNSTLKHLLNSLIKFFYTLVVLRCIPIIFYDDF